MPRRKLVMKFVKDVKKRELTYKNRLRSLVNKISQLAALCGVDILLAGVKSGTAGVGGNRGVTTWPAERGAEMVTWLREMPTERFKENLAIGTYLEGELGKEQRKLVKVKQCRLDDVLTLWDHHLDDLTIDELITLHQAMSETLERARRQIAQLGSVDVVATSAVAVTAPALQHAPVFPANSFDLNMSDAGSSVGSQEHYYLPPDVLPPPFPVQSHYVGFQFGMQPSCLTFGAPPMPFTPFQMAAAPLGFSFPGGGINITDRPPAATAGFYEDLAMQGPGQGFAAGPAVAYHQEFQSAGPAVAYHQDFLTYSFDAAGAVAGACDIAGTGAGVYGFDAAGTGAGYELDPRAPGSWPLGTPNNPVATAAYQLQNDTLLWPDNAVGHHALGEQEELSRLRRFDLWM